MYILSTKCKYCFNYFSYFMNFVPRTESQETNFHTFLTLPVGRIGLNIKKIQFVIILSILPNCMVDMPC